MATPDHPPVNNPNPPERDHYTIDSIKRTICAAILIQAGKTRTDASPGGRGLGSKIAVGGGVIAAVLWAVAASVGIEIPLR